MEFNPDPNKQAANGCAILTAKIYSVSSFNDTEVPKVNEQKHLGLTFDKNLLFEKHINVKIKTAQGGATLTKHFS